METDPDLDDDITSSSTESAMSENAAGSTLPLVIKAKKPKVGLV